MKLSRTITVTIDKTEYSFPFGSRLEDILTETGTGKFPVVGAFVNGYIRGLDYTLVIDCKVSWIDTTSNLGCRMYRNNQRLILLAAHNNVLPGRELHIQHTLGDGTFCESRGDTPFTDGMMLLLSNEIRRLIEEKVPIERRDVAYEDAKALYHDLGDQDKEELITASCRNYYQFYQIGNTLEGFFDRFSANCSQIPIFELRRFHDGFIMRAPSVSCPDGIDPSYNNEHIGSLFLKFDRWAERLDINTVGDLNRAIRNNSASKIIEMAETMQTQNIFEIGAEIIKDIENIRVLLIAGPSSSGKTTFSHKLSMFFRINGIEPVTLAMDDYFVDRQYTPLDEKGDYDFESIQCVDLDRFDHDLESLVQGKPTETPVFDFIEGKRKEETRRMQMNSNQILVIEGIHCLNERVAASIPAKNKRRLYMSVLTPLNMDRLNPISSTDIRILRRMTRDKACRNISPEETILRWESVQKGENINILPYQENADFFLNTALIYETAVLKPYIVPALQEISSEHPVYNAATRFLELLDMMRPIDASLVPPNSLLREFIGGSAYSDHS